MRTGNREALRDITFAHSTLRSDEVSGYGQSKSVLKDIFKGRHLQNLQRNLPYRVVLRSQIDTQLIHSLTSMIHQ